MTALLEPGPLAPRQLRGAGDVPHDRRILLDDVYGWFERVAPGTYALTPKGRAALAADRAVSTGG